MEFSKKHERLLGLRPDYLAYLFYLGTAAWGDGDVLMQTDTVFDCYGDEHFIRDRPMSYNDIEDMLATTLLDNDVDPKVFGRFWKAVYGTAIKQNDAGNYVLCREFFGGRMADLDTYDDFADYIRDVCETPLVNDFRTLGYMFCMLNHMNPHTYIVSDNVTTKSFEECPMIDMEDFCTMIGVDTKNVRSLQNAYRQIRVMRDGKQKIFCGFLGGGGHENAVPIVNPYAIGAEDDYPDNAAKCIFAYEDKCLAKESA